MLNKTLTTSWLDQWRQKEFESGGHTSGTKRRTIFCRAPPLFGFISTISRFGERFRDGQYSLVSVLLAVTCGAPPCPAFVKVERGAHAPNPMELVPLVEI